jgi:flagellar biosynthesis/type III secretory pathway protein FliH
MQSYSRLIKGKIESQKSNFSEMNLPEFGKSTSNPELVAFSASILPDFSPKTTAPVESAPNVTSELPLEPVARHYVHSAVLRSGQMQSSVNGWYAPVLQGNISHHVKAITSSNTEEVTRLITQAKELSAAIVAEANEKSLQLLDAAKQEADSIRQKAFMEGMNAAKAETAESMHQVGRVFQETQLWQEQVMHQSQGLIMGMIVDIGRKLFGDGFVLPAEQLDHIVGRAINEGSRLGNLRIYLHPEDAKVLVNLWQESEITVNGQQIQIISSQNISRGGCFIDGQFGIVDGRVEEQIDQIAESLKPVLSNLELEDA